MISPILEKYRNMFVRFLVQMKKSKSHPEITWPLIGMLVKKIRSTNLVKTLMHEIKSPQYAVISF